MAGPPPPPERKHSRSRRALEWCGIYVWTTHCTPWHPMPLEDCRWNRNSISSVAYRCIRCACFQVASSKPTQMQSGQCLSILPLLVPFTCFPVVQCIDGGLNRSNPFLPQLYTPCNSWPSYFGAVHFCRKSGQLSPFLMPLSRRRRRVRSSSMVLLGQATTSSIV